MRLSCMAIGLLLGCALALAACAGAGAGGGAGDPPSAAMGGSHSGGYH